MMRTVGTEGDATATARTCEDRRVRGQREVITGAPARAGLHVLRALAALVIVFVIARAAWYPFWAMTASSNDLANSWGGPNAFLATIAHWLVAGLIGAVALGVWMLCTRLLRERW
jgi:hypothetical protein